MNNLLIKHQSLLDIVPIYNQTIENIICLFLNFIECSSGIRNDKALARAVAGEPDPGSSSFILKFIHSIQFLMIST